MIELGHINELFRLFVIELRTWIEWFDNWIIRLIELIVMIQTGGLFMQFTFQHFCFSNVLFPKLFSFVQLIFIYFMDHSFARFLHILSDSSTILLPWPRSIF